MCRARSPRDGAMLGSPGCLVRTCPGSAHVPLPLSLSRPVIVCGRARGVPTLLSRLMRVLAARVTMRWDSCGFTRNMQGGGPGGPRAAVGAGQARGTWPSCDGKEVSTPVGVVHRETSRHESDHTSASRILDVERMNQHPFPVKRHRSDAVSTASVMRRMMRPAPTRSWFHVECTAPSGKNALLCSVAGGELAVQLRVPLHVNDKKSSGRRDEFESERVRDGCAGRRRDARVADEGAVRWDVEVTLRSGRGVESPPLSFPVNLRCRVDDSAVHHCGKRCGRADRVVGAWSRGPFPGT